MGARVIRSNRQQSSTEIGPNPRDPLCAPKPSQSNRNSCNARVVLSAASNRNPCQRLCSRLEAFCSRDTSSPCNHDSASGGKMRTSLAKRGHRNRPLDANLSSSQTKDFMKACPLGIQGDGQHQPKGFQSPQLAIATPLPLQVPPFVKGLYDDGVKPFCK